LEPLPDDVTPAAYAGSQLSTGLEPPELAYAGLPMPGPDLDAADMAPEDTEIAEAIGAGAEWMTELLARLVDRDTTPGKEEAGQAVMREALLELGLEPVDVRMDSEALRAHPAASPFDWDVGDKSNVVATWSPTHRNGGLSLILNGHIDVVSPEPRSQWDRDPFTAHVEADWLYGRGAADMKCGPGRDPRGGQGAARARLTPHAPASCSRSSRRSARATALQTLLAGYRADAAIIAEPSARRSRRPRWASLWFDVVIEGLPGHAAEAGNAVNAIEASLAMIGALRVLEAELNAAPPPPYNAYPHPISLNVGQIHAGDWNSTVPGECVTGYRFAAYPGMSLQELRSRVEQVVADAAAAQPAAFPRPPRVVYRGFAAEGYELAQDHLLVDALSAPTRGTWVRAQRSWRRPARPTRACSVTSAASRRCASVRTRRPPMGWASGCTFRAWSKRRR
jgi:acetylornithine deacetylase